MTLHFRDGRGTTLLRYRNRVEITVRMCAQKPCVVCRVRKYAKIVQMAPLSRGTQRQFSENIWSENDLRSRIFGTFFSKISCLSASPRIFEHLKSGIIAHFNGFLPQKGHLQFSEAFFLAEIFEKVSFDAYNFWITRLSARKSEQMKNF